MRHIDTASCTLPLPGRAVTRGAGLIDRLTEPWRLGWAFEALLSRQGQWSSQVSMEAVRWRPAPFLLELADELRSGHYRANPPTRFSVHRPDGRTRELRVYAVRDRVVQKALLSCVAPTAERLFSACSYGFRPGLGVDMAVCRAREALRAGYAWILHTDVRDCFGRIEQAHACAVLTAVAGCSSAAALCRQWLDPGPKGLPQGMALSPLLCNLVLHGCDMALQRIKALAHVRYADDIVLLAPSRAVASEGARTLAQSLALRGLELNRLKTQLVHADVGVRFLGRRLAWRISGAPGPAPNVSQGLAT